MWNQEHEASEIWGKLSNDINSFFISHTHRPFNRGIMAILYALLGVALTLSMRR